MSSVVAVLQNCDIFVPLEYESITLFFVQSQKMDHDFESIIVACNISWKLDIWIREIQVKH